MKLHKDHRRLLVCIEKNFYCIYQQRHIIYIINYKKDFVGELASKHKKEIINVYADRNRTDQYYGW